LLTWSCVSQSESARPRFVEIVQKLRHWSARASSKTSGEAAA
ncbi:unnamed protein product, partial [Amoebophrya sp. A25]